MVFIEAHCTSCKFDGFSVVIVRCLNFLTYLHIYLSYDITCLGPSRHSAREMLQSPCHQLIAVRVVTMSHYPGS